MRRLRVSENVVVEEREPPQNRNIVSDQTIRLSSAGAREKCPHLLRRVEAVREDTGETLVFLTNLHHLGASTIAARLFPSHAAANSCQAT